MLRRTVAIGTLLLGAVGLAPLNGALKAQSSTPPARQPTGKWVVNFADAQCFLSRDFGTPEQPLTLIFQPSAMGDQMQLVVVHRGRTADYATRSAKLLFHPGGKLLDKKVTTYALEGNPLVRHGTLLKAEELTHLSSAATLRITVGRALNEHLVLPKLADALKILEECRVELLTGWGFPRDQIARFGSRAEPLAGHLGRLFSPNDYPRLAVQQGISGKVLARIGITEAGEVSSCDVARSSGSKSLDETTCKIIMKRARYKPARDKAGRPMASIDVTEVNWLAL